MKTLSVLLISLTIISFSLKAQTSEQKQKEQKVQPTEAQQLKKDVIMAQPKSEKQYERKTVEGADQKPMLETSPVRKAVTTNGVQKQQSAQPKKEVTQSEEAQPKTKQIEREVPKKSEPR